MSFELEAYKAVPLPTIAALLDLCRKGEGPAGSEDTLSRVQSGIHRWTKELDTNKTELTVDESVALCEVLEEVRGFARAQRAAPLLSPPPTAAAARRLPRRAPLTPSATL